jgi:iron complex outermembrane recepter protein
MPLRPHSLQTTRRLTVVLTLVSTIPATVLAQRPDSTRRDSTTVLKTIEVRGSAAGLGQARTGNALTKVDLQVTPAGTSGLKAVSVLPGVNMNAADPFGLYEWSTRITMRGFQSA